MQSCLYSPRIHGVAWLHCEAHDMKTAEKELAIILQVHLGHESDRELNH